ncbi:MAG: hypothetical protein HQ582_11400 [Planctomycetes bacterium]|nr:hypothetical protein [Planctomycetota bacterium]
MIPDDAPNKIKSYHHLDRLAEGFGPTTPRDGEEFFGRPYGWIGENSQPYIEVIADGRVVRTVNVFDVAEIVFDV